MRQPCVFCHRGRRGARAGCASAPAADDPIQLKLNDIDARVDPDRAHCLEPEPG